LSGDPRTEGIPGRPAGGASLRTVEVSAGYGGRPVVHGVSIDVGAGQVVSIVGPNGSGKSTLLKTLIGELAPLAGKIETATGVRIGYFDQKLASLAEDLSLMDEIRSVRADLSPEVVRQYLAKFRFFGDDPFRTVRGLSGGERSRLAMAKIMLFPRNVLVLDEPTNHLDIRAKDILLSALSAYTGTVVFVSHDRYFIDKLATRVFEIGGGKVEVYPGNYEDFLWRKQGGAAKLQEAVVTATHTSVPANGNGSAPSASAGKAKRINPIKRKQMEERAQKLEEQIATLESAITACESFLQNFVSAEETARLTQELDQSRRELQERTTEWEKIGEELETSAEKF
jgi:ATP-binding cassette, subfamily F, member 3